MVIKIKVIKIPVALKLVIIPEDCMIITQEVVHLTSADVKIDITILHMNAVADTRRVAMKIFGMEAIPIRAQIANILIDSKADTAQFIVEIIKVETDIT